MNDTNLLEDQPIAWTPTPEGIERAQLTKFMRQVGASTWEELFAYSINDVEKFTGEVIKFLDIKFDPPYEKLLDTSDGIEFPNWCAGGGLNITEVCLDRWQTDEMKDQPAVIWEGEAGDSQILTYGDLLRNVDICVRNLSLLGIKKGDAVGIHLPMILETIVALLAINRLGGIAVPVFSGYGIDAITSRMDAVKAKALFTCYGTTRRGKPIDMLTVASRAVVNVSSIEGVIVVEIGGEPLHTNFADETDGMVRTARIERHYEQLKFLQEDIFAGRQVHRWGVGYDFLEEFYDVLPAEKTLAEDPLIILYTSGTTGKPKGIVHTTGGYLTGVYATTKMVFDLREDDVYWCTADIGWVTGHSYVVYGPLANGATVLMYEGAPDWPQKDRFWSLIERHGVTVFYTAPTAIRAFMRWGAEFPQQHDLSSLRLLGSVGEPINPEAWVWYYKFIGGERCPVVDTWWQTETGAIMITPLPGITTLKPGSATRPFPGISAEIRTESGETVEIGGGLLALTRPWPSMLRGIYGDPDRYVRQYWNKWGSGVYVTGDGAKRDADGYYWLLGRVDDVINVAGHRLGTMEIESALVDHPAVAEAAVVGRAHEIKGQAIAAFVTLKEGIGAIAQSKGLIDELKQHVVMKIGAIARPDDILFTADLPKTRSGKIMRRLLRDIAEGKALGDTTTLADPAVVAKLKANYEEEYGS